MKVTIIKLIVGLLGINIVPIVFLVSKNDYASDLGKWATIGVGVILLIIALLIDVTVILIRKDFK